MTPINAANWERYAAPHVHAENWTAIVPAAGSGSRLGFHLPKILYPVGRKTILEWLLEFLQPNCQSLVFVLSLSGRSPVEKELERLAPGKCRVVIQEIPTGMGDAVDLGLQA